MSQVEVHLELGGVTVRAGTLWSHRRRGTESASFAYVGDYLARPDAYQLDPLLPLVAGTSQTPVGAALFGAFTDSAPDRWGRRLVQRREAATAREEGRTPRSLGEIDFLLGVRDDLRQGALRFTTGAGSPFLAEPESGVPALTDLPELLDLAARAEADTADLADLTRLVGAGSSLGGARPKAHVRRGDGTLGIAKFPSAAFDTWNVMAWEKVVSDLAAAAGIDVPRSELLEFAGRHVLVVDRFDRATGGERVGYVSAMTMLEAKDGDQRSYLEIAEVIETRSLSPTAELHQLWRRIAFSVLVSNTDDHLRNHGFLHDRGDSWRLAPAFDLNPDPTPGAKSLSTLIDTGDSTADLDLVRSVAGFYRLAPGQADEIIREVSAAVSRWRRVAATHGLPASEIDRMSAAFPSGT